MPTKSVGTYAPPASWRFYFLNDTSLLAMDPVP